MQLRIAVCLVWSVMLLVPHDSFSAEAQAGPAISVYEFSFPGGLAPSYDTFTVELPRTLTVQRRFTFKDGGLPRSCVYSIPECGRSDRVDTCDLQALLASEVVRALWPVEGEKVYGGDARHYDGGVFTISTPGMGDLTVGELCRDDRAECSPDHRALLDLRHTATRLRDQALSSPSCTHLQP